MTSRYLGYKCSGRAVADTNCRSGCLPSQSWMSSKILDHVTTTTKKNDEKWRCSQHTNITTNQLPV